MAESARAFIALSLPTNAATAVSKAVDEIRALAELHGVRGSWTRHPHVTLVFLGQTSIEEIETVQEPLRKACLGTGPIQLEIGGVGGFPSLTRPRVLWLGLTGPVEKLMTLQARVATAVASLCQKEERKFNPHITVGRFREPPSAPFTQTLKAMQTTRLVEAAFTEVHLFRSELSPKGAKYTPLLSVSLEDVV